MKALNKNIKRTLKGLALALAVGTTGIASANQQQQALYKQTLTSVTWVESDLPNSDKAEYGTGAVIDAANGLMVTAYHVVQTRPDVVVYFPAYDNNGNVITDCNVYEQHSELAIHGRVIASSSTSDVAIIKLDRVPNGISSMKIAQDLPSPGEDVYEVGNSSMDKGYLWRFSAGMVRNSVMREQATMDNGQKIDAQEVEMQIPTNCGDSGGPLVNDQDELIAIDSHGDTSVSMVEYGISALEIAPLLNQAETALAQGTANAPVAQPASDTTQVPATNNPSPISLGGLLGGVGPSANTAQPPVAQPSEAQPSAKVSNVQFQSDVTENGQQGFIVHMQVEIDGANGQQCMVAAVVGDSSGAMLHMPNNGQCGNMFDGLVGGFQVLTPNSSQTVVQDLTIFIPYDAMISANGGNGGKFQIGVEVKTRTSGGVVSLIDPTLLGDFTLTVDNAPAGNGSNNNTSADNTAPANPLGAPTPSDDRG